jgi:ribulose-phosphate 3-epimerase
MISNPADYAKRYREAGADLLTFHIEVVPDPAALLAEIRASGAATGLSINPPTPLSTLEKYLNLCDFVLVMSVMPGFGGQTFQTASLDKLRQLRARVRPEVLLSVDGGVNFDTIGPCAEAGADVLVVGTALMGHPDYRRRLSDMQSLANASAGARVSKV